MCGSASDRPRGARRAQAGFTLVEVVVATGALILALALVGSSLGVAYFQHSRARGTNIAVSILRDVIAEIQVKADTDMNHVYSTYANRTFTADAIPGVRAGLVPVPVSTAAPTVLRAYVGKILCWNDETGGSMPAGASAGDSQRLGLPLDLNMDDDDGDDDLIGTDMKVVPLKIVLDFQSADATHLGAAGTSTTQMQHIECFYLAAPQR